MNLFGMELGGTYVAYMGRYDGVRGSKDLGMIYVKIWGIRVK